jgi:hypothetical protein
MNLTQKISQMTPKGADLDATDLIEVSTIVGGSYVTKSITGQELIDAIPLPPTGLTVGTTPISSGTNGRVLFQGTGNVLQQSSSLFWDNATNQLQLVGTGLFSSGANLNVRVSGGGLEFSRSVDGAYNTYILKNGTTNAVGLTFAALNGGSFIFQGTSEIMRTSPTNNLLIGTTTDAGFRLDVNGTARVRGMLTATNGSTSSIQIDAANRKIVFGTTGNFFNNINTPSVGNFSFVNENTSTENFRITNQRQIFTEQLINGFNQNTTLQITGNRFGVSTTSPAIELNTFTTSGSGYTAVRMRLFNGDNGNIIMQPNGGNILINTSTDVPSSKLTIESTTQGFLPPRMTTTQKNAIASPATGLQVFDTTLNRPCFYDGTTWITL